MQSRKLNSISCHLRAESHCWICSVQRRVFDMMKASPLSLAVPAMANISSGGRVIRIYEVIAALRGQCYSRALCFVLAIRNPRPRRSAGAAFSHQLVDA